MQLIQTCNLQTPIDFFKEINGFQLYIKREDKTFSGFGTKIRKFDGLYKYLIENKIKKILIYGNPHSNYLATFIPLLSLNRFQIHCLFYTNDSNKVTPNSILSTRFAQKYESVAKNETQAYIDQFLHKNPDYFLLPQFAFHPSALSGLDTLWTEIAESQIRFDYIFLDIGSGLTSISYIKHRLNLKSKLIGVSIGLKLEKMKEDLSNRIQNIGLEEPIDWIEMLAPKISPSYGSVNLALKNYILSVYKEKNLFLEPIYSAKSIYTIENFVQENNILGTGLYVHQGGQLNHIGIISKIGR